MIGIIVIIHEDLNIPKDVNDIVKIFYLISSFFLIEMKILFQVTYYFVEIDFSNLMLVE